MGRGWVFGRGFEAEMGGRLEECKQDCGAVLKRVVVSGGVERVVGLGLSLASGAIGNLWVFFMVRCGCFNSDGVGCWGVERKCGLLLWVNSTQ